MHLFADDAVGISGVVVAVVVSVVVAHEEVAVEGEAGGAGHVGGDAEGALGVGG